MDNTEQRLLESLKAILKHVKPSWDNSHFSLAVMIPAAQALRNQADAMDLRDKEIETARKLVYELEKRNEGVS